MNPKFILMPITCFFVVISCAILISSPKKTLIYQGIIGAFSWFIYLCFEKNIILANFLASIFIALSSHTMARYSKVPVTVYFIPIFMPFVPGMSLYKSVFYLINADISMTNFYFFRALEIAGIIALAIFISEPIVKVYFILKNKVKKTN